MKMLEERRQRGELDLDTFTQCARIVVARTGGILDSDSAWPHPNQKYILERGINRGGRIDRDSLLAELDERVEQMGKLWDLEEGVYRRFDDFQPAKRPPCWISAD